MICLAIGGVTGYYILKSPPFNANNLFKMNLRLIDDIIRVKLIRKWVYMGKNDDIKGIGNKGI